MTCCQRHLVAWSLQCSSQESQALIALWLSGRDQVKNHKLWSQRNSEMLSCYRWGNQAAPWGPFWRVPVIPVWPLDPRAPVAVDVSRLGSCFHGSVFNLAHIKQSALLAFQGFEGFEGSFPDSFYPCLAVANKNQWCHQLLSVGFSLTQMESVLLPLMMLSKVWSWARGPKVSGGEKMRATD